MHALTLAFLLTAAPAAVAPVSTAPASTAPAPAHRGPISWVSDDYPAALAAARQADKPLVIDLWAPWCHSCRSMQHTVLAGEGMVTAAPRFVWLAMNTDTPAATVTTSKYPQSAWPTFLVVDPFTETVQARHVGTASPAQFRAFLDEGERAFVDARGKAGALGPKDPRRHMRAGDQAAMKGDHAAAATAYAEALKVAPAKWPGRAAARVSLAAELSAADRAGECVDLGLKTKVAAAEGPSAADFVAITTGCADKLPDADPRKTKLRKAGAAALAAITGDAKAPLSPDDRADALGMLRGLQDTLGDKDAARKTAETARALLDAAVEKADSPAHAATFNMARVDVYTYLGQGEALVAPLQANVDALPTEYDPPYRLAQLLMKLGRPDDARKAAEAALARVQGPRTARALKLLIDVHTARKDAAAVAEIQAKLTAFEQANPPKK